jgi:ribonuclease P protein component
MQRLKKRADFLSVAKGARAGRRAFTLQAAKRAPRHGANGKPITVAAEPVTEPRVGFTVTKKVGNAVERNRIRRRLRAAVDRLKASPDAARAAPDHDYVLVGRRDALTLDFAALVADLRGALVQVMKPRGPKGSPPSDAPPHRFDRASGASPDVSTVKKPPRVATGTDTPLTDAPRGAASRTDR